MNSITEIWEQLASNYSSKIALKDEITGYSLSFTELYQNINKTIKILNNHKISKGDKVILFVRPHPLWHVIDQAIMKNNSISIPCEISINFEEVIYNLKYTNAKSIFTSSFDFVKKCFSKDFSISESFIIFYIGNENVDSFKKDKITIYNFIDLINNTDTDFQQNTIEHPNDVAKIVFSSGSTGEPKGAMITHENLFLAVRDYQKIYGNISGKQCINIHSCSHLCPWIIEIVLLSGGNTIIYTNYINFLKTVKKYKTEYLCCVPKLLTIINEQYKKELYQKGKIFLKLHNFFFHISAYYFKMKDNKENIINKIISQFLYVFYYIYHKYFRNSVLDNFINNKTMIFSFGSLVVKDIELFFKIVDIDLHIIYGSTEAVTYISYISTKYNIINKINPQLTVEIRDLETNDKLDYNKTGLITIKGKQNMKGYYKNEATTKEVFDSNGYLLTGDLGYINDNGCLFFEGRAKNIIALNNGEKVNPVKIEDICKQSPFVEQIIVIGQEKPYLTALIVLDKNYTERWLIGQNIDITKNNNMNLLKKEILININNLIAKNKFFKWIEQVKNISFIDEPFTIENGMLTKKYTMARNKIYENYRNVIENMYK